MPNEQRDRRHDCHPPSCTVLGFRIPSRALWRCGSCGRRWTHTRVHTWRRRRWPWPRRLLAERTNQAEQRAAVEDLLGAIWLYVDWRYVIRQLTTEQKELWADAVDAASRRLNAGDSEWEPVANRWWRDV